MWGRARFARYRTVCIDCGADPPVLGSPLGTTPRRPARPLHDADIVVPTAGPGDPRGPGGPPHSLYGIAVCMGLQFWEKRVALWLTSCPTTFQSVCHTATLAVYARRPLLRGGSEEHTSELQSLRHLVCRLLL